MANIVATYHKDCIDGTAAAAVLLRKFPEATLIPLAHSYTPDDIAPLLATLTPETVCYTLDSGLGAKEMLAAGCSVTTIDHHMGAKEIFAALAHENERYTFVFDNDRSGASLAWTYLFPGEALPRMIELIEDSDLWRHQFGEETKHANNYLSMFRNDPKAMLALIEGDLTDTLSKGAVITQYVDLEIAHQTELLGIIIRIGEYAVPAYNITSYESASGNILAERQGCAVVLFTIKGREVKMSLRSKDGQTPSALTLAKLLGGGGHEHASGASVSLDTFISMME